MSRKQKLILLGLGAANVLIVALLIFLLRFWMNSPAPVPIAEFSPCTQQLLSSLPEATHPAVVWEQAELTVALTPDSDAPGAVPAEIGGQYLWTALDALSTTLKLNCAIPEQVILTVTFYDDTTTRRHVAILSGDDVTAWVSGELPGAELAAQTRYRLTERVTPQ